FQPPDCGEPSVTLWERSSMRFLMILLSISSVIIPLAGPANGESIRTESKDDEPRVARLVQRHFQNSPKHRVQRLLTHAEVESLFEQFRGIGVDIPDKHGLLRRLPGEREVFTRLIIP